MFSADWAQEAAALAIAVGAAVLLVWRLVRPTTPRPRAAKVQLGGRLARGLARARPRAH